jgi:hypothetical protein
MSEYEKYKKTVEEYVRDNKQIVEGVTPDQFRKEHTCEWTPYCSVHNYKGVCCLNTPIHFIEFNGNRIDLCEECYQSYLKDELDLSMFVG